MKSIFTVLTIIVIIVGFLMIIDRDPGCSDDTDCGTGRICISKECVKDLCGNGICEVGEDCSEDCYQVPKNVVTVPSSELCGNGICDTWEDETTCCRDCSCGTAGEACDLSAMMCVSKKASGVCGDGVCDYGESVNNCCNDCPFCRTGETCDTKTRNCVVNRVDISEKDAIASVKPYLAREGFDPAWVADRDWDVHPDIYEGSPVLMVCASIPKTAESFEELVCVRVTEKGEVKGLIQFW